MSVEVQLFTEVLTRFEEAVKELHRAAYHNMITRDKKQHVALEPLRARIEEKRQALIGAYSIKRKAVRVYVSRMETSREDETKYEHFVMAHNGSYEMSFWMRHKPEEALFHVHELAKFLGVEPEPLIIDGKAVELDEFTKMLLRGDD